MNPFRYVVASLAFLPVLLSLHLDSQAQDFSAPLIISERVGEQIDAEERTYFGLFPRVEAFVSSVAYETTDSTAAFLITRQEQPAPDTLDVSMASIAELGRFIDHFEYRYRDKHAVDWGLIIRLVRPVKHLYKGQSITLILADERVVSGRLLYADTSGVVLTQEKAYPERLFEPERAVLYAPSEIKHIKIGGFPQLFTHREAHIPEATRGQIYEAYTLPRLRQQTALPKAPSPEVRRFVNRRLAQKHVAVAPAALDRRYINRLKNKVHLFFFPSFAAYTTPPRLSYSVEYGEYPEDEYPDDYFGPGWRSSAINMRNVRLLSKLDYSLHPRIWVGVAASYIPEPRSKPVPPVSSDLYLRPGRVDVHGFFLQPTITWVAKAYDPFPYLSNISFITAPAELRVSVGPSLALLKVDTELRSWFTHRDKYERHTLNEIGGFSAVDLDLYLNRFVSLGLGMQALWIPGFHLRTVALDNPHDFQYGSKKLLGTAQPLFLLSVHTGLRFHL